MPAATSLPTGEGRTALASRMEAARRPPLVPLARREGRRLCLVVGRGSWRPTASRRARAQIKGGIFTLPGHMSDDIKDLISRMLVVDPLQRITIP